MGVLDLIQRKVGIFFQGLHVPAVLRVPCHASRDADAQFAAAGQHRHTLVHGVAQDAHLFPDLLPAGIAVEQQHELIAGQAGHHRAGGGVLCQTEAGAVDVLVAPVVAIGVVDVLEVIQIHHQQGCGAQLLRVLKQLPAHPLEGLTVVQAGEDIVVPFVLDAQALQRGGGDILGQTHLHVPVFGDAQQNVAGLAVLADGQQLVSPCRGGAGAGKLDPGQRLLKAAHAQETVLGLGFAQQGKKVIGNIHAAGVEPQLIAAQLHTGHIHDAQKLCGVVQQLAVQAGQCIGQTVQLPDLCMGQLRELLFLLPVHHLVIQQLHRAGQLAGDQQAAQNAQHQRAHHHSGEHMPDILRKGEQRLAVHCADQQPVLIGEGRVAAVQEDGHCHRVVIPFVQVQPAAVCPPLAAHHACRLFQCIAVLTGRDQLADHEFLGVLVRSGGHQKIRAAFLVLQLCIGHFFLHIAGEQLHAHHAVHRAVRQDQRLRVGNGRTVIARDRVCAGGPAAVIFLAQAGIVLIGPQERFLEKAPALQAVVAQDRLPAFIGGDAQRLDHRRAAALDQQVGILLRRAGVRVQIPQIDAGHTAAHIQNAQVLGVQHHKNAGDGSCAQGVDQLRCNGGKQRAALFTVGVQGIQIQTARVHHGKGGPVDVVREIGQVLCILHQVLHVTDAVAHLHGKHVLCVLVQPAAHIGDVDADDEQQDLCHQYQHHRPENGAEDRLCLFSAPGRPCALRCPTVQHHSSPLSLRMSRAAQPSYCASFAQMS